MIPTNIALFFQFLKTQLSHPETRQTPLHVAVDNNRVDVAELLLSNGADVNAVNQPNTETPLHMVKSVAMAEILVNSGASLAAQNAWLQTPLHCACKSGEAELVKYLISSGGMLDAQDQQGRTPLHYCSAGNRDDIAECLIQCGCSISKLDSDGFSALTLSELMGFQDVAKVIKRHQSPSPAHQPLFSAEK
jgi:ankyrin